MPELLNTKEAARLLGLSPQTLANWRVRGGEGPRFVKAGSRCLYSRAHLEEWIAAHTRESTSDTGVQAGCAA